MRRRNADLLTVALVLGALVCLACEIPRTVPTIAPSDQVLDGWLRAREQTAHAMGNTTMAAMRVATSTILAAWYPALMGIEAVVQAEAAGLDPVPAYCASRPAWAERGIHTDDSLCMYKHPCWVGTYAH